MAINSHQHILHEDVAPAIWI